MQSSRASYSALLYYGLPSTIAIQALHFETAENSFAWHLVRRQGPENRNFERSVYLSLYPRTSPPEMAQLSNVYTLHTYL